MNRLPAMRRRMAQSETRLRDRKRHPALSGGGVMDIPQRADQAACTRFCAVFSERPVTTSPVST